MPSRLRNEVTPELVTAIHTAPLAASPKSYTTSSKRQRMSVTQTYFVASQARSKLSAEACKPDHNLRLLVGHANLLDNLMLNLADAEREQEAWFHDSVVKAEEPKAAPKHISWADSIPEDDEDEEMEDDASDSDSELDYEEFALSMTSAAPRRFRAAPIMPEHELDDHEPEEYEDYEFDEEHALVRTQSHPPELLIDNDSDSEDESMPPSPPSVSLELDAKAQHSTLATLRAGKDTPLVAEDANLLIDQTTPMIASY